MTNAANIVPFGKYKGQPLEVLQGDPQYVEWLMGQAWFRERYGNVYTLVVNNFAEPSETPEHNRLQTRFLDDEFCLKLLRPLGLRALREMAEWYVKDAVRNDRDAAAAQQALDDCTAIDCATICMKMFEHRGWDVALEATFERGDMRDRVHAFIEIKPSLGDDYPAVLRQMHANAERVKHYGDMLLVIDQFTAAGATFEQAKKVFRLSGFRLLTFAEIEGRQ